MAKAVPPEEVERRKALIQKGFQAQQSLNQIAAEIGLAPRYVRELADKYGLRRPEKRKTLNRKIVETLPLIGAVHAGLLEEEPDFLCWLAGSIPKGGTVSEFLIACAVDQYLEEKDAADAA